MQADYQEKIWGRVHEMPSETVEMMQGFLISLPKPILPLPIIHAHLTTGQPSKPISQANMMTTAALIGVDSTPMEGFQKDNVEKLLSEKGLINLDEYRVSVMAAFGYRTGEPKRAKTRQAMEDII